MSDLALDGGPPVRPGTPLPSFENAAGRTIGAEEEAAALRVLRSGMLSGVWGSEVPAFAHEFAELMGTAHAVPASSGTAALHLAVAAVDPEPGDEVIVPPLTDMGTVFPILAQNAVPVFADVDPVTGNLDPERVAALIGPRTKAIIAVHVFGKPAPVERLREIADAAGIMLIEDCAQAYLAPVGQGRVVGSVGHVGCFSLQQYKHITTGDGGVAVTNDPVLAQRMRRFADKGWPRETGERAYLHFALNYRMTELVAAVAREQLRKLPGVVERRRAHAAITSARLAALPGLSLPPDDGDHVYWHYPLVLDGLDAAGLQRYAAALTAEGVPAVPGYLARPLYAEPVLREQRTYGSSGYPLRDVVTYPDGLCPVAEELIERRLVVLPWNENYAPGDVEDIVAAVTKVHTVLVGSSP